MEEYPTPSNQVEIDAEKLKFYNSQLKVWKYAKNSAAEFQKHSFDYRSSILKKNIMSMLRQNILLVLVRNLREFLLESQNLFQFVRERGKFFLF